MLILSSSLDDYHTRATRLPENQFYMVLDEFVLESGEVLPNATVAFTVKGRMNAQRTNLIVVCHALSGSAVVEDWWAPIFSHANPALDLSKFCIVCCNSLGSPYGSSSPLSIRPDKASAYGNTFPKTTIRDDVL